MSPSMVWLITQPGWTIWTHFDIGSENGRERLDYYAVHRMTNDRDVRLYADGDKEDLPAMRAGHVTSPGCFPETVLCEAGGHVRALFAFQRDAVAVEESWDGGRVAVGPAANGGDSEVGDHPGRGGNAAPVAIVSVVVDNAEIETAAHLAWASREHLGAVVADGTRGAQRKS